LKQEILKALGITGVVGSEILCFDVIDSTNTYLRKAALDGAVDGTVVIADYQTAGRGRLERSFQSPAGKGIYLSVLLRPQLSPESLLPVTALAGVAVCNAVEKVCGVRPGLKWPNDLVLGNRKLCGILAEMGMDADSGLPYLVLGVGLNVLQDTEDFSPEIREIATSLTIELKRHVSRSALAAAMIEELDQMYAALKKGKTESYLVAYRKDCVNLGKAVQLIGMDGLRESAEAVDVDETFGLVVQTSSGIKKTIRWGEVSVRGLYGYID